MEKDYKLVGEKSSNSQVLREYKDRYRVKLFRDPECNQESLLQFTDIHGEGKVLKYYDCLPSCLPTVRYRELHAMARVYSHRMHPVLADCSAFSENNVHVFTWKCVVRLFISLLYFSLFYISSLLCLFPFKKYLYLG